jgi:hypothetical protein
MRAPKIQPTDLAARRRVAGASIEGMAAGIGLSLAEIREIESGAASHELRDHYARWLDIIETWSADKRAQQLLAAIDRGRRFEP